MRALRDCKQRSLTVSKKAPTVSKKASPEFLTPAAVCNVKRGDGASPEHEGRYVQRHNAGRNLRPFHPPRGVLGPFGPKVGNGVENGLPAPGPKKSKTESKKSQKVEISTLFQLFWLFFDSFFNFLDPGAGRPRELIFNSVSNFGPKGPKNSSGGMEGSQAETAENKAALAQITWVHDGLQHGELP